MIKKRIAIFISGRGSNMKSLVDVITKEDLPIDVSVIVSDQKDAGGLIFARDHNIKTAVILKQDYKNLL